jgi:hypothetical protein
MLNALCVTSGNECAQLDILDEEHKIHYGQDPTDETNSETELTNHLKTLQLIGVKGVMVDCWWGRVEAAGPGRYNWDGYEKLFSIVRAAQLKLHVSLPPKAVFRSWGAPMNCVIFGGFEVLHV